MARSSASRPIDVGAPPPLSDHVINSKMSASLRDATGALAEPLADEPALSPRPLLAIALCGVERRARLNRQTKDRWMREAVVIDVERQIVERLEGLAEGVGYAAVVAVIVGLFRWQWRQPRPDIDRPRQQPS